MELRHLRYFVSVAEEQNVRRAARRLGVSQPPLTRQIKQLEEEVGAALFVRTSRGVRLTDAGEVFLEDARRVLQEVDFASARAQRAGRGEAGRIDVALFGTGIFGAIPVLLRAHRDAYPEVQVVLHNMTKAQQVEALQQKRIGVAFNRLMRPTPGVTSEVLLTEPLYAAMPADHPLATESSVCLSRLKGEPMVVFPTGYRPSFIDRVYDMCAQEGFVPNTVAEVADVVHGIGLVASGHGLCLVPWSATHLAVPGLAFVQLKGDPPPSVGLCCITRDEDNSPALVAFVESVRATARQVTEDFGLDVPGR